MDVEVELYEISDKIKSLLISVENQRVELEYASKYFKDYIKEICIPNINKNLNCLESSISHLEIKRGEDDEFTMK